MRVSRPLGTRLFLLFGAVLFALGIFFISNRHRLFTKTFIVYADFARLNGIEKGATVRLSGLQAGEVLSTEITKWPEGRLRLKLVLGENLHPFVRADSVASIQTTGLAGNTFVDIKMGTAKSPEVSEGGTLPTVEPLELADLMQAGNNALQQSQVSLRTIQAQADTTLLAITTLTQHVDGTLAQLRPNLIDTSESARRTASGLSQLTQGVQRGEGLAGEVMVNPELAKSAAETVAHANAATLQLDQASTRLNAAMAEFQSRKLLERSEGVLQSSQQVTTQLSGVLGTPQGTEPTNLQATLADTQRTMSNLADDTEAMKHNFLLRGFFKNRGYYDLQGMNPDAYRASKFLEGHTHSRSWIAAVPLFVPDGKDSEVLSAAGKAELDHALGTEVPHLPNNAVMIEGYSDAGSPEQAYLVAQERAALVRAYLIQRYGLSTDMVGMRAMGSMTPAGSEHTTWNGVALVVLAP